MQPLRLRKLSRSFYLQPTLKVAKELLGLYLCRKVRNITLIGRIVEVEAYLGEVDPASHAYRGRTNRNAVMFSTGGHLYVYFTYGMHFCCNVVTEQEGTGRAILLRAVEPVQGVDIMARNRKASTAYRAQRRSIPGIPQRVLLNLCSGPAKLCQAFGITGEDNGADLCANAIWIAKDTYAPKTIRIGLSGRVGITAGREQKWRLFARDNPFVSRTKVH